MSRAAKTPPPLFLPADQIALVGGGDLSKHSAGLVFARVWLGRASAGSYYAKTHEGAEVTIELCDAFTARRGEEMALVRSVDLRFQADRRVAVVENQYVGGNVFTAGALIEARARWVMALEQHGFGEPMLVAPQSWQAAMLGTGNAPTDVRKARSRTAAAELALLLGRVQPLSEDESDALCLLWWYLRHFLVLPLPAVASQKWTKPKAETPKKPRVKKTPAAPSKGETIDLVHACDFAQQPDIRIACTQEWTRPAWGHTGRPFRGENGMLYTFNSDEVTCHKCKAEDAT